MPNNDYVKREDIFPAVTEIAKEIVFGNQDDDKVVDIINSIPAADVEPKRRWIPVTERLPENNGRYLVIHPLHNRMPWITVMYFGVPDGYDKGICFYIVDDEWGDSPCDCVTYWMPLPELPKEADV